MACFPFPVGQLARDGTLQGSKWLKFQLLIEPEELEDLMGVLDDPLIANVGAMVSAKDAIIAKQTFAARYRCYVDDLAAGKTPSLGSLCPHLASAWSGSLEAFCGFPARDGRFMVRAVEPVIQLSPHFFLFSWQTMRFYSMTCGLEMIPWGLQFSYPQVYSRSTEDKIHYAAKTKPVNQRLFDQLKKWVRRATKPAKFFVGEKRVTASFRITQKAAIWMASHPRLIKHKLKLLM